MPTLKCGNKMVLASALLALFLLLAAHTNHSNLASCSPLKGSYLRDPMPWEDGYFDPSYHSWSKQTSIDKSESASKKTIH